MRLDPYAWPNVWWGLNRKPSDYAYSALTHQATLPEPSVRIVVLIIHIHALNILLECIERNTFFKIGERAI